MDESNTYTPGVIGSPGISVHLTALDVPITLRAHGAHAEQLHASLVSAWSRCLRSGDDVGEVIDVALGPADSLHEVKADIPGAATFDGLSGAMDSISSMVTLRAIEQQAGELVMLHACAAADVETGLTVALIGPSGAGKTTAAGALCERFAYVTDETVGVTDTFAVLPYPKPLSLVTEGQRFKKQVSPDELGYAETAASLRLHAVLLLDRTPGLGEAQLESVPPLPALTHAATETSFLGRLDAPLHRLAATLARGPGLKRVRYGDAGQLVDVITELFHPAGSSESRNTSILRSCSGRSS